MAEINLKDLEAIQTSLKSISNKTTFDEVKKSIVNLADSLKDSLEEFQRNEAKARQRRTQLNATHLQDELKKRLDLNKRITTWEAKQFDERFELNKRYHTRVLNELKKQHKEREFLEKKIFLRQVSMNKEFYGKIDESFKKLNDKTSKLAGKLDSIFGTGLFTSLQKISSLITGFTKNALKLTLGGLQFIQTARQGGIKKAFQQTKIGQGIRTAKRTVKRAASTIRKITGAGVSGRIERKKEKEEAEKAQSGIAKGIGKTGKTQEAALIGQVKFFEWFKKWWIIKFLWEKANFAADKISKFLGLGGEGGIKGLFKAGLGKFFSTGIGKFIGGTSGGLLQKTLTSMVGISGAIGGIKGAIKGISQFGAVSEKYGGGAEGGAMGVAYTAKKISSGILSGLTMGLVSPKSMDKLINTGSRITEKFVDALSPNQKFYDKLSQAKTGLSKRSIDIGKQLDSIYEKTGMRGSQAKALMADKEKWNKLTKEEQDLMRKRAEGATKRQKAIVAKNGFPSFTTAPRNIKDTYKQLDQDTDFKAHKGELVSILNKQQAEMLNLKLPARPRKEKKGIFGKFFSLFDKKGKEKKTEVEKISKAFTLSTKPKYESNYDAAAEFILKHEGYKSNNKADVGGKTIFGIASHAHPKEVEALWDLPKEQARETAKGFYKEKYWEPLPKKNLFLFDTAVNMGPGRAKKWSNLSLDEAYNARMAFYQNLVDRKPSQGQFLKGWTRRTNEAYQMAGGGAASKEKQKDAYTAKEGASFAKAPKDFMLQGHAGEGAFVAKSKEFTTVFKYFEMGKKLAEEASGAVKDVSMAFAKDKPGQALKNLQKEQTPMDGKDSKIVKLLSDIKTGIEKGAKMTEEKTESKSPSTMPTSTKGGEANYKPRSDVFPSDTMFTNMYALVSQFSGGY